MWRGDCGRRLGEERGRGGEGKSGEEREVGRERWEERGEKREVERERREERDRKREVGREREEMGGSVAGGKEYPGAQSHSGLCIDMYLRSSSSTSGSAYHQRIPGVDILGS